MTYSLSLELLFTIVVQFVAIVASYVSIRERVKFLENAVLKLNNEVEELQQKHELIVRIEAKLDMLITSLGVGKH